MQRMIEICQILIPYCNESQLQWGFEAEHDIIYFNVDWTQISDEILQLLDKKYGVFYDEETDSLAMYV